MASTLVWIAYPLSAALVVLYGLGALAIAFYRQKKQGQRDTTEFFLTARNSVGALRISWAFYASSMGSWALFSVAQYVSTAGGCCQCLLCQSQTCIYSERWVHRLPAWLLVLPAAACSQRSHRPVTTQTVIPSSPSRSSRCCSATPQALQG